jgi:PAS domain S-box-containing protein
LLRLLSDAARDFAIFATDPDGTILTWNPGVQNITGYDEHEFVGCDCVMLFTPEEREKGAHLQERETAKREGQALDERWRLKKDGTRFWGSGFMHALYTDSGDLKGFAKIMRDMTAQKRLQDELREREELLSRVIGSSPDCIKTLDLDGHMLSMTEGGQRVMEVDDFDRICGVDWLTFWEDEETKGALRDALATARAGGTGRFQGFCPTLKGTPRWWDVVVAPILDAQGRPERLLGVSRDITEQRQAQEELRRSHDQLEARVAEATAQLRDVTRRLMTSLEQERRRISRELHDQTGQHLAALGLELGLLENDAVATRDEATKAARAALRAAGLAGEAAQAARAAAMVAARTDPIPDAGRAAGTASEAARMAAIAGTDARAAAAAADAAMAVVDKAAPRVKQLRELAESLSHDIHRIAVDLRPTSLDDLGLVPALQACAEQWSERHGVPAQLESVGLEGGDGSGVGGQARRLPPDVETALYRIVQEALTNAAKYAVPGGATQVSITLLRRQSANGSEVLATIEDDGPGFDPEAAARSGRLGLAGMQERAELLGGTLEVESSPGSGTTIYARLPVTQ